VLTAQGADALADLGLVVAVGGADGCRRVGDRLGGGAGAWGHAGNDT
jgi:hypothetical protein